MRKITTALLLLTMIGCSEDSTTPITPPPPPPPPPPSSPTENLLVTGGDMSGGPQSVTVRSGNAAVTGAAVVVNGTALADRGSGLYSGTLAQSVNSGGQVTLAITAGTKQVTGVGTVPAVPVILSAPGVGRGAPVHVTWSSTVSPDSFFVSFNYLYDNSFFAETITVGGDEREGNIPTNNVPASATNLSIGIFGFNIGTFTGDVVAGSNMRLRTLGINKAFTFGAAVQAAQR